MAKSNWNIGDVVKVGFLSLRVASGPLENQDAGMPKYYKLESIDGSKRYQFVPHNGLYRVA